MNRWAIVSRPLRGLDWVQTFESAKRTIENSPAIYGWVSVREKMKARETGD